MMPEGSTAGSPGPLPAEDREKVRAYVAACLGRGEMVAATAHTRLFAQTGVRLSYPSFSRYWRDAVEAGGAVETPRPSLLDIARGDATGEGEDEAKVIHFPGGPVVIDEPGVPAPGRSARRRAGADERVEIRGAAGTFSAEPASDGRWKVQMDMLVTRSTALQLMCQSTALLLPPEAK